MLRLTPTPHLRDSHIRLLDSDSPRLLDSGPAAATVPSPANSRRFAPAGRGIVTDPQSNVIETTDGYRFEFSGNQVKIDWPGRTGDGVGETTFVGNTAFEADGGAAVLVAGLAATALPAESVRWGLTQLPWIAVAVGGIALAESRARS